MINPQDLDRLIHQYLEGTLDAAGLEQLDVLLKTDPKAAERLAEWSYDREALIDLLSMQAMPVPSRSTETSPTESHDPIPLRTGSAARKPSSKKRTPIRLRPNATTAAPRNFFTPLIRYSLLTAAAIWMMVGLTWLALRGKPNTPRNASTYSGTEIDSVAQSKEKLLREQRLARIKQEEELVRLENQRQKSLQQMEELARQQTRLDRNAGQTPVDQAELERTRLKEQLEKERRLLAEIDELAEAARRRRRELELARARDVSEPKDTETHETKLNVLGRVVYVKAPENKDVLLPVLVRQLEPGRQARLPVEHGMSIKTGDRIETMPGTPEDPTATRAALELNSGITVDVADNSAIQFMSSNLTRLDRGQIYANYSNHSHDVDTGAELDHVYELTIETPAGRVSTTSPGRCNLSVAEDKAGKLETRVRVENGSFQFGNDKGRRELNRNQESGCYAGMAPTAPTPVMGVLWRGRKNLLNLTDGRLPFDRTCPVIWTNDNPQVWFAEDYLMALSSAGEIDLRGLVTSLTNVPNPKYHENIKRWVQSLAQHGVEKLPPVMKGCTKALQKPASGQYRDTQPEDSEAVQLILDLAHKANAAHPLVIISAGGLTDTASAYLRDPSIRSNVIVFFRSASKDDVDLNFDPWAGRIVLDNLTCVVPQGIGLCKVDADKCNDLPASPLRESLRLRAEKASADCEVHLAMAFTRCDSLSNIHRASLALQVQDDSFFVKDDEKGNLWLGTVENASTCAPEFWRALALPGALGPKK